MRRGAKRYALKPASTAAQAPWADAMRDHFDTRMGPAGRCAAELLIGGRAGATTSNYKSKVGLFLEFCAEVSLDPLRADTLAIVHYVHWLGLRGTVRARNLQPYLSAVNQLFADLELAPPGVGPLIALAKRGLALRQTDSRGDQDDERPWLPASAASSFVEQAEAALGLPPPVSLAAPRADASLVGTQFVKTFEGAPFSGIVSAFLPAGAISGSASPHFHVRYADGDEEDLPADELLQLLAAQRLSDFQRAASSTVSSAALEAARAPLASAFGFVCANRAGTTQKALFDDLFTAERRHAGDASLAVCFRVRHAKGQHGQSKTRVLTIPVDSEPAPDNMLLRLWRCLRAWKTAKRRLCPKLSAPGARLWQLASDLPSCKFDAALQSRWLSECCELLDIASPFAGAYTSHALRHGAASAMAAIQIPMHVIRNHGGWAPGSSTLEHTYVHHACRASPAAWAFFGHLRVLSFHTEHPPTR